MDRLLDHLEHQRPGVLKWKQATLNKIVNYLGNNRDYMNYKDYLVKGYPIGTRVIEGTCCYLVKDRFE